MTIENDTTMIKDRIIEQWTQKTDGAADGDRDTILNAMANDMGVPRSVLAQHISEWEASKSVK